jgi:hypothetical protein
LGYGPRPCPFRWPSMASERPPQKRPSSPEGDGRGRCQGAWSSLARSILVDPLIAGAAHPRGASTTDLRAAAVMLVIGGDVADRGVQPDRVVFPAHARELAIQDGRGADRAQVRPVALEMAEEALDGKRRTTGMKKGMKESYVEDAAKSRRPRVMRWRPVRAQRSVGRGGRGPGVEPRNVSCPGCRRAHRRGRQHRWSRYREWPAGPAGSESPSTCAISSC